MQKRSDGKLFFINFARVITYCVYGFFVVATVFLITGFFLLLFGANKSTSFVQFVYHFAAIFLEPFRGIFPGHQVSDRSYFSGAALFAIIFYGLSAMALHSLITFITLKKLQHQRELDKLQQAEQRPQRPTGATRV